MVCRASGSVAVTVVVALFAAHGVANAQGEEVSGRQRAWKLARELEIPARRAEAAAGLLALGAPAVEPLLAQARHPDLDVARTALQVLADLGPEGLGAVPALEKLAKGEDAHAAAAAWALARLPRHGTFLLSCMNAQQVVEIDGDGKTVWKSPKLGRGWSIEGLASGNLLLAEVDGNVREYDRDGKVVWEYTAAQRPYDAQRLIDGNTLIADFGNREVVEVDPKGEIVWRFENVTAIAARRLSGGTTLITDYNGERIIEVDRAGEVVWELKGVRHSYGAERLRDGSTLVIQSQDRKVLRFDRDGEQVGELESDLQPSHALALPDGWLVCGQNFLRRMRADGTEVWQTSLEGWCGRIYRR